MKDRELPKISWNVDFVKGLTRAKFIKRFEKIYPGHDLGREYDAIVPPKKGKDRDKGEEQVPKEEG